MNPSIKKIMRIGKEIDDILSRTRRGYIETLEVCAIIIWVCVLIAVIFGIIALCTPSYASQYTIDDWVDAVYMAEGGASAQFLYGIRSVKYKDKAEAREICYRTIERTLISRRKERCKEGESDLDCLSRRYAPLNADNDPSGLNKNWKKNVLFHLRTNK